MVVAIFALAEGLAVFSVELLVGVVVDLASEVDKRSSGFCLQGIPIKR